MAEFVTGPATEVVKCFAEPIKRQFNYLCCFNTNIQNLRDEAKRLDDAKEGVDGQVEAARSNVQVIVPRVKTWQDVVSKIQADMSGVETEILNVKGRCLAIMPRFSLSRKAKKMAAVMKELQDDCGTFGQICYPPPSAAMSSIPHGQVYELKSRKDFEEDIMATLREKKLSLMGIYGMGGVGKTTMAKKIMTRAREERLFDEIVIAVVSQPIDMLRIQKELAELLGLNLGVDGLLARAHLLRGRLMNTKSILIVLDDLWNRLNLEELGIPKECTILLTSRNRDVFCAMNVDKTFQVKTLDDVEAWSLFKEKVGACADDQSLFPIAQEIVQECKGLPIAIVTVGGALKDKMNKSIWEDAVQELRSCNPQDIPDFLALVYNPLKLSYDILESVRAKSIFLLCCLFPEDHDILISNLCLYAWGLGIFEGISRLQVAWNKMQTLVEMLKSRSLLLDGKNERYVKMHDIVRDVGIFIAAKKGLMWAREESNNTIDCSWISSFRAHEFTLPEGSVIQNLRFLLIEEPSDNQERLSDNLFESTRKLCVLSIRNYNGLRSLPHTIQLQKNMRTLILYGCIWLEDISVVGELVSLEILRCRECYWVTELPVEIGRLNRLKLLDISNCYHLETIKAGVISRLIRLEELTLIGSFNEWELAVEEGKNAAVCELNLLSRLTKLKIQIEDGSLAAVQIHLPNLVEFDITIGDSTTMKGSSIEAQMILSWKRQAKSSYGRQMTLGLKSDVIIGDWIPQLLRSTERLFLEGEGSSKLLPLLPQFLSLKELKIRNAKFPVLEVERTEAVFGMLNYPRLEVLKINNCGNIKSLFSSSIAENLINLRELIIESCCEMVKVIEDKDENKLINRRITFPKLDKLLLHDLPRLTSLCKGIQSIEFPLLTRMEIKNCPDMKNLVSTAENETKCDADDSLHLFCKSQAPFGMLKILRIDGYDSISSQKSLSLWCDQIPFGFFSGLKYLEVKNCGNTKSLFSPSIAGNLVNLIRLRIESCDEMVKVIEGDEDKSSLFIKLEQLWLTELPMLRVFCDWRYALQLPSLKYLCISECPEMERFSFGSFTTPNLPSISKNGKTISKYTEDLNDVLFGEYSFHLEILFGTDQ